MSTRPNLLDFLKLKIVNSGLLKPVPVSQYLQLKYFEVPNQGRPHKCHLHFTVQNPKGLGECNHYRTVCAYHSWSSGAPKNTQYLLSIYNSYHSSTLSYKKSKKKVFLLLCNKPTTNTTE